MQQEGRNDTFHCPFKILILLHTERIANGHPAELVWHLLFSSFNLDLILLNFFFKCKFTLSQESA